MLTALPTLTAPQEGELFFTSPFFVAFFVLSSAFGWPVLAALRLNSRRGELVGCRICARAAACGALRVAGIKPILNVQIRGRASSESRRWREGDTSTAAEIDNIKQREGFLSPRHDAQDLGSAQSLSVLSPDPDTTRRPSGEIATLRTYDEARSSQKYSGRRNALEFECPRSVATHSPVATSQTLSVLSFRRRHDAPPVRGDGNAPDLRRSQIITKVQRTPQRTSPECPSSVATHSPVATSHTLSVLSRPQTRRAARPETRQRQDLRRSQIITKVQWTPQRT